jgi:hypothetical protein
MEDFGLSGIWEGLKKILGDAGDLVWSGIKKLASATVSMLAGVPGFIVKSAITFMIWCAFNPITSILGYIGLKNPKAAAETIQFLSAGITHTIGGDAGAKGLAAATSMGATVGGVLGGKVGSAIGAGTAALGGHIRNAVNATYRMGQGTNAAGSKANITPNNLTKVIGPNSTDIARSDSDTVKNLGAAGDNSLWGDPDSSTITAAGPSIAQDVQDVTPKDTGVWKSIQDAATALNKWIGDKVTEEAIQSIADFVFNWGIPIAATAAIIYGGQLLYEYITTKTPPNLTESKVAKMIKSSLAKQKAAGNVLGGGLVTGPKKLRAHLNRNTVGAQAVPTAESMRAIINKLS